MREKSYMKYMLAANEDLIAKEWEKYAGYTVRPLPSTIDYYSKIIYSQYKKKQLFLTYGGTPEIRNIFQNLNINVCVMDKSEEMIRAMGRLTHLQQPIGHTETILIQDWLEKPIKKNYVDFVIGDDAINMVDWNQFDLFLSNTHHLLSHKGIFVCHLLVKPDDYLINKSFSTLMAEYKSGKILSIYDLASQLNFICFDKQHYSMGWQQTIKILGKEKLDLLKPDLDFINTFGYCNSRFYCPPQKVFERLVKKYFSIVEIFYPHEHEYCLFEPVYVLEKV